MVGAALALLALAAGARAHAGGACDQLHRAYERRSRPV